MATTLFEQLKAGCAADWQAYTDHAFVRELAAGTLPEASFRHFLVQDYLFLVHFSRAWALAVYKAGSLADMRAASEVLDGLLNHEIELHVDYCARWGLDEETLAATPEARANMAYTRYVLDTGLAGDALDLLTALAPCVVGYAEIGRTRWQHADTKLTDNPYRPWLETYAGEEFQGLAETVVERMDRLYAERGGDSRLPALQRIFTDATRLEQGFWAMGYEQLG